VFLGITDGQRLHAHFRNQLVGMLKEEKRFITDPGQ
jgi:hypothetical protein